MITTIVLTILCIFSLANLIMMIFLILNSCRPKVSPPQITSQISRNLPMEEEKLAELKQKKEAEDKAFEELMNYNAAVAYGIAQKGIRNE